MLTGFPAEEHISLPLHIDPFTRALIFDIDGTLVNSLPIHF
jgi:hypothetical protein